MGGRNSVKFVFFVMLMYQLIDAYIIHFDDVYLLDWVRLEGQIADPVVRDYPIIFPNNREIIKSLDVFIHVIHKNCLQEYIHISWKKEKKRKGNYIQK